ncbi:hypothetical protein Tco_1224206, partial [Tanacetum coccineum]
VGVAAEMMWWIGDERDEGATVVVVIKRKVVWRFRWCRWDGDGGMRRRLAGSWPDSGDGAGNYERGERRVFRVLCVFRGRGRCEIGNETSGSGMGDIGEASGGGRGGSGGRGRRGGGMASSGGRRGGGRGSRGVGSTRGGGMAGSSSMGILTSKEEYQLHLDELAFRECMEEQAREQEKINAEQEREDSIEETPFNQAYIEVFIPSIHSQPTQQSGVWVKDTTDVIAKNIDEAPAMETSETTDVSAMVEDLSAPIMDKGKGKESVEDQASAPKKKRGRPPSHVDGSAPDKAFDVDD